MKLATTILVGLTVVCQWHFILNIVHEMSTVLDIAVFRVWQSYRAGRTPIDQAPLLANQEGTNYGAINTDIENKETEAKLTENEEAH